MPYIKKQPNPNFQEPVFIPKTKIVDSGQILNNCGWTVFGIWTLDEDGLLTVDGSGRMPEWNDHVCDDYGKAWHRVREKIKSVRIVDGVTNIGEYAFYRCSSLESISIPNSVTSIEKYAFWCCESLESINLPNSVTRIEWWAFSECSSLKSINLPNRLTSIEGSAFRKCSSLKSIIIPKSVRDMGDSFDGCDSLKCVRMPEKFNRPFFKFRYGISKQYVEFY